MPSPAADLQVRLDASRKELLDLTFRNPLLNYRALRARGVEAVEADVDAVFEALVQNGRSLAILPAEDGRRTDSDDPTVLYDSEVEVVRPTHSVVQEAYAPSVSEALEELFRDLKGEIQSHLVAPPAADTDEASPERSGRRRRGAADLQAASPPGELFRRLLNTQYTARSFIEEQGINTLFLALGMLVWYEGSESEEPRRSPLVLVPVELQRTAVGDRFTLRYTDEEIIGNASLAALLAGEQRLELPPLPEDLTVSEYLQKVELIIAGKSRWSVEPDAVALAFFSFSKYLMYRELEDAAWPAGQEPTRHPILGALLANGFQEAAPGLGDDDPIDRALLPAALRTVVDADSSQLLAVEDVKQGRNLVIQGPPGTGKSQTITNIIAEAVGQKKTVLFVSEKMAALEVVKHRLDAVGLGDACLELHSNKTNKKAFLAELKRTLDLGCPVRNGHGADDVHLLTDARDRLNAYCDAVNTPVAASGRTPHDLFGDWLHLQAQPDSAELPSVSLSERFADWTPLEYRQREQVIAELQAQVAAMGAPPRQHPFWGSARTVYISTEAAAYRSAFQRAETAAGSLRTAAAALAGALGLPAPADIAGVETLAAATQRAIEAPSHEGVPFSSGQWLARQTDLTALLDLGAHLSDLHAHYDPLLVPEAWERDVLEARQAIVEHGAKWYRFLIGDWRRANKELRLLCADAVPADIAVQRELLDAILDARRSRAKFREMASLGAELFGAQWQGERSNWPVLRQLLAWIVELHREVGDGSLPRPFLDFLSGSNDLARVAPQVAGVQTAAAALRSEAGRVAELLELQESDRFGPGGALIAQLIAAQEALFGLWSREVVRLQEMSAFNHTAARCRDLDLDGVVTTAVEAERGGDLLLTAFRSAYCQALLRRVFERDPALANFQGVAHAEVIARFRDLDQRFLLHNRLTLAAQHWDEISRVNALMGGSEGQLRVLTREFEKRSRHLPIRQLLERAGNVVRAVKPVFMMSPLSVATFLTPGVLAFDLIVFDEASQVKPVDALGSLLRGRQAVVVGDSKQLPPTDFFDSLAQSDTPGENDESQTADMESILGTMVGQGAPQRLLRWHYRSRHESLIAVSNQEFYENKLVIFPSPDAAREESGLVYHHLPETVYDRGISGTNRQEARAVAEAVMAHAARQLARPARERLTLGVAAFSMGQAQAIRDQIELLRRQFPDAEPFFATAGHEPFFVKNLENVQGDERDVIFISIGYGRDKDRRVSMNFGPLNGQGGERRLNVLISRARLRCEVFTNLLPEEIDLTRTAARGVQALRTFLAYARTGHLDTGTAAASRQEPTGSFEQEVAAALHTAGYTVVPQVGCAGCYIDLAVVDPERPGHYLLGIECDGRNYHTARSARDRDRLRDAVLRQMGWRLHRVWSADWVHRYDDEIRRLLAAVEEAHRAARAAAEEAAPVLPETAPDIAAEEAIKDSPIERVSVTQTADAVPSYMMAELPNVPLLDLGQPGDFGQFTELLHYVVSTESPVHRQEASRRLAAAMGVSRVTANFEGNVDYAASILESKGRLRRQGGFYWMPSMTEPALRSRAKLPARSRKIELIAPEEIAVAVRRAVSDSYGISQEGAIQQAAEHLGFERVTAEMREYLETIVQTMIDVGTLATEANGQLRVKGA